MDEAEAWPMPVHGGRCARAARWLEGNIPVEAYGRLADRLAGLLHRYNDTASGPTHRIAAFCILHAGAPIGDGETTDKGYINQRGVLTRRAALVDELYSPRPSPEVIRL